ncbi:MAG: Bug family tripartite tricarboxylate transporter substrate binding protein, partial [Lautropia sp.]
MAGVRMLHVPYKGNPPAVQDLIAGQVQVMVANMPSVINFLQQDKRLVGLAVASPRRNAMLPDLPTISEAALPGYDADVWQGLLAPAGTPPAVIATLNAAVRKVMDKPEVGTALAKIGAERADNSPAEFAGQIRRDIKVYGDLVQTLGLKLD